MNEAVEEPCENLSQPDAFLVKLERAWIKREDHDRNWACDTCNQIFPSYESVLVHLQIGDNLCKIPELPKETGPDTSDSSTPLHLDPKRRKLCPVPTTAEKTTDLSSEEPVLDTDLLLKADIKSEPGNSQLSNPEWTDFKDPDLPLKFNIGPAGLSSQPELVQHNPGHASTMKIFKCGMCQLTFESIGLLYSHFKNHTVKAKEPVIPKVPLSPASTGDTLGFPKGTFRLETASRSLLGTRPLEITKFKCGNCGRTFKRLAALSLHMKTSHSQLEAELTDRKVAFDCQICGIRYTRLQPLYDHFAAAHDPSNSFRSHAFVQVRERRSPAPSAQTASPSLPRYTNQYKVKPHSCLICDGGFACKPWLFRHQDKVHAGRWTRSQCPWCVEEFNSEAALGDHLESHTELVKCFLCGILFPTAVLWENHARRRHVAADGYYHCPKCDLKFESPALWDQHSKTGISELQMFLAGEEEGSGEVLPCPQCPCVFSTKDGYELHVRTIHLQTPLPVPP